MEKKESTNQRIQVLKLPLEERKNTKTLWKEIFSEDTDKYLEYYNHQVVTHNEVYATESEGKIVSMLHLNPYSVHMGQKKAEVHFIVAVAVKEKYRRQGRMAAMLNGALNGLYEKREPFTFLTPVSEEIYLPFGFRTVAGKESLSVSPKEAARAEFAHGYCLKPAEEKDLGAVSKFSSDILEKKCMVHVDRSLSYMRQCQKEQEAMNGGILLFYRKNKLAGYCFTGDENGPEVWEIVMSPGGGKKTEWKGWSAANREAFYALAEYFSGRDTLKVSGFLPGTELPEIAGANRQRRPAVMVRIVNLAAFVEHMTAKTHMEFEFCIKDKILKENNGSFRFILSPEGGRLIRLKKTVRQTVTVETLTDLFFGSGKEFLELSKQIRVLCPVYFTELA